MKIFSKALWIGDPKQLANLLNQEIAKAGQVVKDAGIQPE